MFVARYRENYACAVAPGRRGDQLIHHSLIGRDKQTCQLFTAGYKYRECYIMLNPRSLGGRVHFSLMSNPLFCIATTLQIVI